jgi:hypothetical protein
MSNSNPNIPIVNLGNLYIQNLGLTYSSTTALILGSGQARDASDVNDIVLSSAASVSVSSNGANGLDTGTIAASTLYYVYVIGSSNNLASSAGLLSLSASAPLLPYNYDMYRRVGAISTDSSSHIRPFTQTGKGNARTMWYDPGTGPSTKGLVIPSSGTGGSTSYVNLGVLTTLVPQFEIECLVNVAFTPNSANNVIFFAPATIDNGTTATVGSVVSMSAAATGSAQVETVRVPCSLPNSTQRSALTIGAVVTILYATSSASDAVVFLLNGYIDQL